MVAPRIYVDFHNADAQGRLRLNCIGTAEDLTLNGVQLKEGMLLTLYSDDLDDAGKPDELLAEGVVAYSDEEHCWVAHIDWAAIHHASIGQTFSANGVSPAGNSPVSKSGRTASST
jgi:hypothetical protein